MSRKLRCRPSQLVNIYDPYAAYCLDEATYIWGTHVEIELENSTRDKKENKEAKKAIEKRQNRFQALMVEDEEVDPSKPQIKSPTSRKRFKDPADLFKGNNKKSIGR